MAFFFAADLAVKKNAAAGRSILVDGSWRNQVALIDIETFRGDKERLLPNGLLGYL